MIAAIILAILVFIAMITVSYRQTQYANNTATLVAHTQEELYTTAKVLATITDNETGSRGFILTGRQDFLEPLEKSKLNIYKEIAALKQLTANNIHQQRHIDSLLFYANKRVFFSDSTVTARKEEGLTAAAQLVSTGRGKLYVDNIRRIIIDMQEETNKTLQKNKAANTLAKNIEKIIFLAGTFVTLTLIIIIFWKEKQRIELKAQKNTTEQLALLSRQINQSNDAIYTLDADRKIKSWNRGAEKLYGFTKEEVLDKEPTQLLQTAITEEEIETAVKEMNEHDYWTGELKRKTKAGEVIYVYASTTNIRDDNGIITGYVSVSFDINQRKKLEDELKRYSEELEQRVNERTEEIQQSEKNYRYLFQNNPLPMWVFDISSYKFLDVNEMATVHYGYSRNEFLSMTVLDIRSDEDKSIFLQTDHAFEINPVNNDKTVWNHCKKDGTVIQVEISAHQINFENKQARLILVNDVTEKVKAEKQLASSEKRYKALVENNDDIISVLDKNLVVTYRSSSAARITGWTNDEFSKVYVTEYVHPDYLPYMQESVKRSLDNPGTLIPVTLQVKHKNGHYIWLEGIIKNMLHDSSVEGIITNVRDVTKRIQAENNLVNSEKRFRALIENNYDIISLMDKSFRVIYRSPSAYRITGWSDEEMNEADGTKNIHPDDLEYARGIVQELMKTPGKSVNTLFRNQHKKGHYLWMEGTCINLLHDESIKAIVFNYRNVTERIEAEKKLIASEEQFRHSLDSMLEGVQIIGFDWKYIYVNDALCRQGKYKKEELIGYTMMEKYPGIEQTELFENCKRCLTEKLSIHMENEFTFPDGSKQWFELSLQPVPEGIFILSIDITERKDAEEKIKKINEELEERVTERTGELKKANEELEAFSYSVSHDLRAPLRAIIGYSAILEEDYSSKLDDEAKRITTVIKTNTVKMGNLIDDLLTFSRMGRHDIIKTQIDINVMVDEIIKGFSGNGSKIEWTVNALPVVKADMSMLRQVWINLISNAVKYSGVNTAPKIEIGSFKHEGHLVFFVEDNGVGFDEKYKNKLFKVFQRLHSAEDFAGTGVGLAIVEKIISKHNGMVWAEAEVNKGASFYFSLPEN